MNGVSTTKTDEFLEQFSSASEVEEFLEHFGVRGMKWGVRRGKKHTGVGRVRGALTERSQRNEAKFDRRLRGKGTIRDRTARNLSKVTLGKKRSEKYYNFRLNYSKQQKARMEQGKGTVLDALAVGSQVYAMPHLAIASLGVSNTHGNPGKLQKKYG